MNEQSQPGKNAGRPAGAHKSDADRQRPKVATSGGENTNPHSRNDGDEGDGEPKSWLKYATFVFAAAAALGSIAAAIGGGYQGWVARDSEQRQLRAYVGALPGDIEDFGKSGQVIRFVRKNYGSTPAYDVGFSDTEFSVIPMGAPVPNPPSCAINRLSGLQTMFPSMEFPFRIVIQPTFSPDQIQSVYKEHSILVSFGSICYHDAFGGTHYTNYCWMYKGLSMTAKDADYCLTHNDAN